MKTTLSRIPFRDALRVKSAEMWLKLGQPAEALKELKTVSHRARKDPWASEVVRSTLRSYCGLGPASARS